jgi:hypothetical protein
MAFTKVTSRGLRDGNIGIRTAGGFVGTGFTVLNFVGAGNTFAVSGDGTTIDISIAGGGGGGDEIYKETFNVSSTTSTFTLTTGQFDEDFIDVYVNGIKLPPGDFTQTPPNQFTLAIAAEAGDTVEIIANRTRSTNTTLNADVTNLNASGIVSASQFYGSGRNLTNLPVGIGTMLDANTPGLDAIYYVNTTLGIGQSITVNPPNSATSAFTHYTEIAVDPDVDFIVEDGDDFIADILGLGELEVPNLPGNGGRVRADNFTNKAGTGAPNFPNGLTIGDGTFDTGFIEIQNVLDVTEDKTLAGSTSSTVTVARKSVVVADTKSLILGPNCELVINAFQI